MVCYNTSMQKIPCLFKRVFHGPDSTTLLQEATPGCEWVLNGEGVATRKWDGTACAVINGVLHKRYDAKHGKPAPKNGIPCQEPDPITGHWPHWVPVSHSNPADRWHVQAWTVEGPLDEGTYELIGPRIGGNPERVANHTLKKHGDEVLDVPRSFEGIRLFLWVAEMEGIVFHHPDGRACKIRRRDFGFAWGRQVAQQNA